MSLSFGNKETETSEIKKKKNYVILCYSVFFKYISDLWRSKITLIHTYTNVFFTTLCFFNVYITLV